MRKYKITAEQNFVINSDDVETALTQAPAAFRKFKNVEIYGPGGRLSLAELAAIVANRKKLRGMTS